MILYRNSHDERHGLRGLGVGLAVREQQQGQLLLLLNYRCHDDCPCSATIPSSTMRSRHQEDWPFVDGWGGEGQRSKQRPALRRSSKSLDYMGILQ